jgi:hypothetical protein
LTTFAVALQKLVMDLSPERYELYNPFSSDAARDLAVALAIDFREAEYDVWHTCAERVRPVLLSE